VYTPPPPSADHQHGRERAPPWAVPPRDDISPPAELRSAGADEETCEVCPFFGSEAGCFRSFRCGSCEKLHTKPNSVRFCAGGNETCLKKAACERRHRVWHSWEDAEAFYQRTGPYQPPGQPSDEGTSDAALIELYDLHVDELSRAQAMFRAVCGRAEGESDDDDHVPGEGELRLRYARGLYMICRQGWQIGCGCGKQLGGRLTPVGHKNARLVAERAHTTPNLGLGFDTRPAAGMTPLLADEDAPRSCSSIASDAVAFASKWVACGVMHSGAPGHAPGGSALAGSK
jgi:hypothetical protein